MSESVVESWVEPTVVAGEVRDVTVAQVVNDPNAKVYYLDANTKYYEATAVSMTDDELGVTWFELALFAGERTLRKDESTTEPTRVTWAAPASTGWHILVDSPGRYSTVVVLYREGWQP